jgi:anaerobic selenocysteine-containing dehydrogenase
LDLKATDSARLVSPRGQLDVIIDIEPDLHPDAIVVERGLWASLGFGFNRFVEAKATDYGEGVAYYEQRVRLEPLRNRR